MFCINKSEKINKKWTVRPYRGAQLSYIFLLILSGCGSEFGGEEGADITRKFVGGETMNPLLPFYLSQPANCKLARSQLRKLRRDPES